MSNDIIFYDYLEACCTAEATNAAQPGIPQGFLRWYDATKDKLLYIPPFLHRTTVNAPAAVPVPIETPRVVPTAYNENHKNLELIRDMARSNAGFRTTVAPIQSAPKAKGRYCGKNFNPYHQAKKRRIRKSHFLDNAIYKPWRDSGRHWAPRAPRQQRQQPLKAPIYGCPLKQPRYGVRFDTPRLQDRDIFNEDKFIFQNIGNYDYSGSITPDAFVNLPALAPISDLPIASALTTDNVTEEAIEELVDRLGKVVVAEPEAEMLDLA
jgi:hypothetical protein